MGKAGKGIGEAVHDEAGRKEIGVERLAVEAHEEPFPPEQFPEGEERRPLLGVIPGEELPRDEGIPLEPPQADEEGHRPRPPGEPRRFRVEEEGLAVIQPPQDRVVAQDSQPAHVERAQVPDAVPSVARGAPGEVRGAEEGPRLVGRLPPGDKLLQRDAAAPSGGRRPCSLPFRPPGEDGVDSLAECADLLGPRPLAVPVRAGFLIGPPYPLLRSGGANGSSGSWAHDTTDPDKFNRYDKKISLTPSAVRHIL